MYRTTMKYNNGNRHELDRFHALEPAIKSARALHHPDWPTGQSIRVLDDAGRAVFDSGTLPVVGITASGYEWVCPKCDEINKEIECCPTFICKGCGQKVATDAPEHAYG